MSTAEERADMKVNPLPPAPNCSTCLHGNIPVECNMDRGCEYCPDSLHDTTLPPLEQAFHIQEKIHALHEEARELQVRYDTLIERAASANIEKEGPYLLVDKKRSVRVPDPVKFKEQFPDAYKAIKQDEIDRQMKKLDEILLQDLTTIAVKRAEELIGKIPLTKISDEKVYHSYSIQQVKSP